MGDCPRYETKPTRSTQPSTLRGMEKWVLPVVAAIAIGKKRRVLRNSRPCGQDCWYTGPSVIGAGC